jgi:AcrR family transcriptional regulator
MPNTATATTARRGSTRHAGVTRDDVIDTALDIVETDGGDALTMRGLAARLGVAPTTVYWHVGPRDELVLAVVRRQAERQARAEVRGTTPADRVQHAATSIWRNALTHRNVTALANSVGATTLLELPLEVALVVELEAAGLTGPAARDALRSLLACIAGFVVLAWRPDGLVPEHLRSASLWQDVDDARLSPETRAAMCTYGDPEAMFARSIRAVIDELLTGSNPTADLDVEAPR